MIYSSTSLRSAQDCLRRYAIEAQWRPRRWRPRSLFNRLLRRIVYNLSRGDAAPDKEGSLASTEFLECAARPGLDIDGSPFEIAQDWAWALRVAAEVVGRMVLLPLSAMPKINVDGLSWQCESMQDETGALHYWTSVETLSPDEVLRQSRSWRYGDSVFAQTPLTLHLLSTGYVRSGHLHGHLCRIWQHAEISKYLFQKADGSSLAGTSWRAKWGQDLKWRPERWVDLMQESRVDPVRHVTLKQAEPRHASLYREALIQESGRMAGVGNWRLAPMSFGHCHMCPHTALCYGASSPESLGYVLNTPKHPQG